MIFVAVGTQLPFDRLIAAVDSWAETTATQVVAQIGTGGEYVPQHMQATATLPAAKFAQICGEAEVVVSHAGMGIIMLAREKGVPLIVMPRRQELGEIRNQHQLATVRHFGELDGIYVAQDTAELAVLLANYARLVACRVASQPGAELLARLRSFIDEEE